MSLFVFFILAAVLLGAGAMLSPAWRTAQPRIALAATLCLGLIVGGAVFYAEAFGWDTLVVDYLLFALLSGVVLGGTLSTAQARAEARGERLNDRDQGWPGPGDLAFFAFVALLLMIPLFHLAAPLGEQGQVIGLHSLAARDGGSFSSLAPYHASERVIIAPGFHALAAYLSGQLEQSMPLIQLSAAAVITLIIVWLAYDFGAELCDKRLGRAMATAMLLSLGIYRSALDGHFAELLGLLFLAAALLFALRLLRNFNLADLVAAGLMMGAIVYASLSMSLVLLLAWFPLLALSWTQKNQPIAAASRWALTIGAPAIGLLGIAPWLASNLALMLPISPSPFPAGLQNLQLIFGEQGIALTLLALWGIRAGLRANRRLRFVSLLMLLWLLLVIEMTAIGLISRLLPPLSQLTNAPNLLRHGPILPFVWFGGLALLDIWDARLSADFKTRLRRASYPIIAAGAVLLLLIAVAFQPLLHRLGFHAPRLTHDDAAAMTWLRDNSAADAVVLAADGNAWLPIFAERRAPAFRALRYFEWDAISNLELEGLEVDYIYAPAGSDPPVNIALKLIYEGGSALVYKRIER